MYRTEVIKLNLLNCPGIGVVDCGLVATHRVLSQDRHDYRGGQYCERHAEQLAYRWNKEVKTASRKAS